MEPYRHSVGLWGKRFIVSPFLDCEDKVGASLYNNLDAYHGTVCSCFNVPPEQVRCAVLKTGEDGYLLRQIEDLKRENVAIEEKKPEDREKLHVIPTVVFRENLLSVLSIDNRNGT